MTDIYIKEMTNYYKDEIFRLLSKRGGSKQNEIIADETKQEKEKSD